MILAGCFRCVQLQVRVVSRFPLDAFFFVRPSSNEKKRGLQRSESSKEDPGSTYTSLQGGQEGSSCGIGPKNGGPRMRTPPKLPKAY